MMRLSQKYDPELDKLLIMDYVQEVKDSAGDWTGVTFNHTLDMATGNFESAQPMVDEEQWDSDPFWNEEYYAEKIAAAFNWPHSADPGTRWVYRTSDTFIITRALQNYLETKEGSEVDIFSFVVEEVYKPLDLSPGALTTLRTKDNNWQGQPYGGYGMWWIPDDLAKIAQFLNDDRGMVEGEQLLNPDLLDSALQQEPEDRGVERYPGGQYNEAFWADKYDTADGFECEFWVAEMLGYSGIVVVLMPNGANYYYASDGREFTWDSAIREADKILPFCSTP
jgi:CubicO group peptidase (beta-lactamase class C family)